MPDTTRKTGLGTAAFFQKTGPTEPRVPQPTEAQPITDTQALPSQRAVVQPPPSPAKLRTTVLLYPETLERMEAMKIASRRQGHRLTYSDILDTAVQLLAEQQGVQSGV